MYLSIYVTIYVSIYVTIYLSLYLSIYVSNYLCIYLSMYLSIVYCTIKFFASSLIDYFSTLAFSLLFIISPQQHRILLSLNLVFYLQKSSQQLFKSSQTYSNSITYLQMYNAYAICTYIRGTHNLCTKY